MNQKIPFLEIIYNDVNTKKKMVRYSYGTAANGIREVRGELRPNRLEDDEKKVLISFLRNDIEEKRVPLKDIIPLDKLYSDNIKTKIIYIDMSEEEVYAKPRGMG